MTETEIDRLLKLIGIDLMEGKWRILEVILKAHEKSGEGLTFAELKAGLEKLWGKPMKRSLIYRYLNDLEEKGIVFIDRTSHNNLHIIDNETTLQALKTLSSITIRDLKMQERILATKIDQISTLSAEMLTDDYIELLIGKKVQDNPRTAKGLLEMMKLIQDKILTRSKANDIIRCSLQWNFLSDLLTSDQIDLRKLVIPKGVIIHFLINETGEIQPRDFLEDIDTTYFAQVFGKTTKIRVSIKPTKTYQGIYLNDEGIVLLVSMEPYTAVWIPKPNNENLIYDVLMKFDMDFSRAEDMERG